MTDTEISVSNPRISDGGYEKRCKICKTDLQRRRKRKTVRQKNEYATQKKKKNGATEKRICNAEALYLLDAPEIATVLMLCYAIVTALMTVITFYWKISIHSVGVVGPSMALGIAFWPWGLLYFLLLPPIAWSRYVLRRHTPAQLIAGATVGFIITGLMFMWLL